MNVITRYITKELVSNIILSLFVLTFIFITVDFLGRVWEFLDEDVTALLMFEYFFSKAPWVFYTMIPVACLMATLLTFSELSKNSEIVAMYAGGISIWRIAGIIFVIGSILTIFSFLINEFIVPPTFARAKYIRQVHVKKKNYRAFKKKQDLV